jgi:hypothetical protein
MRVNRCLLDGSRMVFSKDLAHRLANLLQNSMRVDAFYNKRHKVRETFFAVSLLRAFWDCLKCSEKESR